MKSILIANRGEIAVRISATAKKMGIKTYAIQTAKEPSAYYLDFTDEVISIEENVLGISEFLDIEGIIGLAKKHKIEAIHPGYGFLAESPYFAQRCDDEGIIFIGPTADAIYKMGNKTVAKQIATKHKIPMAKGSPGSVKDVEQAITLAKAITYPVIIKAASGGGGRGMRIVEKFEDMAKNFRLATKEAEQAFNDPSVFIERYIKKPRHIEFQILGDKHGNVIHLGERECSVQRKHQKLLEEAPSCALSEEMRQKMGEEAVKIAKAVNYSSAGTVEFLLDADNNFYFMEMNTRIQVEHPVTEEVTGVDLIEQMIRIARGEKLTLKQKDIKINGWAIEYRINAEDPQSSFAPNLGVIENMSFPKGKNIRVDTGVRAGSEILPYYDSMIAKLIVTGEDRKRAIANSISALRRSQIRGLKTTIPFHKAVLDNKNFREGDFNTSFIENMGQQYYQEKDEEQLAAFFAALHHAKELKEELEEVVDYNKGKNLNPWILNKRLK